MLSVLHSQYHACWCSGDFRIQDVNRPLSRNIPSPASEELSHRELIIWPRESKQNLLHFSAYILFTYQSLGFLRGALSGCWAFISSTRRWITCNISHCYLSSVSNTCTFIHVFGECMRIELFDHGVLYQNSWNKLKCMDGISYTAYHK